MATRVVKVWRGVVRQQLKKAKAALNSILAFNSKHPSLALMSSAEVTNFTSVVATIGNINDTTTYLGKTRPR